MSLPVTVEKYRREVLRHRGPNLAKFVDGFFACVPALRDAVALGAEHARRRQDVTDKLKDIT
jgi:hypothetical protein